MTLPNGDGDGLVGLRMEAAQRAIEDARLLMESGSIHDKNRTTSRFRSQC